MFSTLPVNTGTVIYQAYSPGLLIDLTGQNIRDVSYDINAGWNWDGGAWGRQVSPQERLIPLLIESSAQLSQKAPVALPGGVSKARAARGELVVGAPNGAR